jgi:drug/metabolite transporter (DMT)-like permease
MGNQRRAYVCAGLAVLFWSTVATAFKITLQHLAIPQLLFFSSLASSATLAAIALIQGTISQLFAGTARQYLRSCLLGILNPVAYYLVLFAAYQRLPAQEAQALNYTWALTLVLLSIPLLRQHPRMRDIVAGLICYTGVLIIGTRGEPLGFQFADTVGVALALGSTVLWALYWIYNTKDDRDPIICLLLGFVSSLPVSAAICILTTGLTTPRWEGIAGAVYIGVFEMGLAYFLWLSALKYSVSAARVANLIFLSPFLSLVLIHHIVGEEILGSTLSGLVLILAGLAVQKTRNRA